jgi:hypothetical protein
VQNQPPERRQTLEPLAVPEVFPVAVEVPGVVEQPSDVDRAIADYLIGDVRAVLSLHILGVGNVHRRRVYAARHQQNAPPSATRI